MVWYKLLIGEVLMKLAINLITIFVYGPSDSLALILVTGCIVKGSWTMYVYMDQHVHCKHIVYS